MPFKIFKNNIYYKYSDQLKNIENKDIYFSRDYIKRNYDKLVKQYNKKNLFEIEYNFIKFVYSKILLDKKKFSLLDYGGGVGNTILEIYMRNYFHPNLKITLYDKNQNLVKVSKNFFKNKINKKTFKNIIFLKNIYKNQKYDAIHFGSMFEHIFNEALFFENIFSKFKKKPKFIFFSDLFLTSNKKEFYCIGRYYNQSYVVKFHKLKTLEKLLNFYKYKLIDKKKFLPKIQGQYRFYDMSNLPRENRIYNTYNLIFEKLGK